jgi:Aspartic acid proteinase inhibitor
VKNFYLVFGGFVLLGSALAQIAGGYGMADVKDPQVIAAAKFAVGAQNTKLKRTGSRAYTLLEISKAEMQVVAGLNFHVCLKTKLGTGIRSADAVVYQDLQQKLSLSSWEWKKCSIK